MYIPPRVWKSSEDYEFQIPEYQEAARRTIDRLRKQTQIFFIASALTCALFLSDQPQGANLLEGLWYSLFLILAIFSMYRSSREIGIDERHLGLLENIDRDKTESS